MQVKFLITEFSKKPERKSKIYMRKVRRNLYLRYLYFNCVPKYSRRYSRRESLVRFEDLTEIAWGLVESSKPGRKTRRDLRIWCANMQNSKRPSRKFLHLKLYVVEIVRSDNRTRKRVALVLRIASVCMIDRRETEHNSHVRVSDGRRPVDFNFLHHLSDNCRSLQSMRHNLILAILNFDRLYNTSSSLISNESIFRITINSYSI